MEAIFNSFLLVAATEMGDKTQLAAFVLATRFKKPWTIFFGIFVATVLNHLLAASVGNLVAQAIDPTYMKWVRYFSASLFVIFGIGIIVGY